MNAFVVKEGRLLLRGVLVFWAAILAAYWIPTKNEGLWIITSYIICPAAALMLTMESFGREFSSKTFSGLLALPVSRGKIWWTKNLFLALALLVCWALWWQVMKYKAPREMGFQTHAGLIQSGSLVYLWVTFSGGLWATLLCRQIVAASWAAVLVPFALALVLTNVSWDLSANVWMAVFTIYGVVGWILAWWLYRRAEDTSNLVGETGAGVWESWSRRFRFLPGFGSDHLSSRLSILHKEVQLHHSFLVVGTILFVVHILVLGIRTWIVGWRSSEFSRFLLENYWMLWVVLPWMLGAGAVAEERRLGIWEGQLCSPVRRRSQVLAKYAVALVLCGATGFLMPLLLDGKHVMEAMTSGPEQNLQQGVVYQWFRQFPQYQWLYDILGQGPTISLDLGGILIWGAIILTLSLVSLWASSLSRSTLQALGPGLLGMMLCVVGYFHFRYPNEIHRLLGFEELWRGPLGLVLGVPLLLVAGVGLVYRNAFYIAPTWRVWRQNFLIVFGVVVVTYALSMGLYHRVWERFTPVESVHGAARWQLAKMPQGGYRPEFVRSVGSGLAVVLPDGRIWNTHSLSEAAPGLSGIFVKSREFFTLEQGMISAGNWKSVAPASFDVAMVKEDGGLWVSEKPYASVRLQAVNGRPVSTSTIVPRLVQYGNDRDWRSVVSIGNGVLVLKTDGTLWRLGKLVWGGRNWPGLRNQELVQLGEDRDWDSIESLWSYCALLRKKDGRAFSLNWGMGVDSRDSIKLEEGTVVYRAPYLDGKRDLAYAMASARNWVGSDFLLALAPGGRLVLRGSYGSGGAMRFIMEPRNVELGSVGDWVGMAGNVGRVVTLKTDGTLWLWDFSVSPDFDPDSPKVKRLGTQSDWVAVTAGFGGVLSMAADGSIWLWRFNAEGPYASHDWFPLLGESSKPVKIAQIE